MSIVVAKRKKLPSIKRLWKLAWDLQSLYIRQQHANFQGQASCYTCGRTFHWKALQAGHFIHGSYDFDTELNIRPQCASCNKWNHGRPLEYYLHLVAEVGKRRADYARTRPHRNVYSRIELNRIIDRYKSLK